ncbi:SipW-dependent-type signal peptide-containing protein [Rhodococcoides fascians]|uniref:SipW-dependent-type signal peptide-containing protein n=1 Tax=Rhodococcoides fascians TaxID=1828 RepID=UPI00353054F7
MVAHAVPTTLFARVLRLVGSARVRALLSLGMVLGLGAVGTLAVWSTSATATSGEFAIGSVDIRLDGSEGPVTQPYEFALAPTSLLPGNSTAAVIAVQNRGSLPFRYGVSVVGSGSLSSVLTVSAMPSGSVFTNGSNKTCTGGTAQTAVVPSASSAVMVPNASVGPVAATTGNANLCIQATLSSGAATNLQGTQANLTLLFTATGATGV